MDPALHQPMDRVTQVDERLDHSDAAQWYDITIAGKQFNIASRDGEGNIRKVERLLEKTVAEMNERLRGKSPTTVAFLTALNLADQLLLMEAGQMTASLALNGRLENLLHRLDHALGQDGGRAPAD